LSRALRLDAGERLGFARGALTGGAKALDEPLWSWRDMCGVGDDILFAVDRRSGSKDVSTA
jgi:hypothetical protein